MRNRTATDLIPALLVGAVLLLFSASALAAGADERLRVGLRAYQDGFYSLAAKELAAFLAASPVDPRRGQVLSLLAQAQIAQQDWDAARTTLLALAPDTDGHGAAAQYWLGWVAHRRGEPRGAIAHLEQYLASNHREYRVDARVLLADVLSATGRYEAAAGQYSLLLQEATGDARREQFWGRRVHALERAGTPAEALLAVVEQALAEGIGEVAVRRQLATTGVRAARIAGAHGAEAKLWSVLAASAEEPGERARARFQAGMARLRGGDEAGGQRDLEAYLAAKPGGPEVVTAHSQLAGLARRHNDWPRVLRHLDAALAQPQAVADSDLRKGALTAARRAGDGARAAHHANALLASGAKLSAQELGIAHDVLAEQLTATDPVAAVRHWLAVPAASARYRDARLAASARLLEQGEGGKSLEAVAPLLAHGGDAEAMQVALAAAEAEQLWSRAADLAWQLAEEPPAGQEGIGYLLRVVTLRRRLGDAGGEQRALRAICDRHPRHPRATWALGELQRLAFEAGNWEASLLWYDQLAAGRAGHTAPAARLLRGEALSRLERWDEARQEYRAVATAKGPFAGPALARLGALLDRGEEWEQAREVYQQALTAGVPDAVAAWIRQRLEEVTVPETNPDGGGQGGNER